MVTSTQSKAITSNHNRIIVWAGPGTGKTTVLTARIAHLILNEKIPENNILALTFTNKASEEMRDRLKNIKDIKWKWLQAYTFHSFFYHFILCNLQWFGFSNPPTIYDEYDVNDVLELIITESLYSAKREDLQRILKKKYTKINSELTEDDKIFIALFEDRMLKKYNALSFDMILAICYEKIKNDERLLLSFNNVFSHVLIDEFQDTDEIQAGLIELINPQNLFLVGDANQYIYNWRGSRYDFLIKYVSDPSFEVHVLDETFRLPRKIEKTSYNLITRNGNKGVYQRLKTKNEEGKIVTFYGDIPGLMERIIREIKDKEDIAILCRTNKLAESVYDHLRYKNIPALLLTSEKELWEEPIIRSILSYFKVAFNPTDHINLFNVLKIPHRNYINESVLVDLKLESLNKNIPIIKLFQEKYKEDVLTKFIDTIKKEKVTNTQELLIRLIYDYKVIAEYLHLKNKIKLINRLHEKIVMWEEKNPGSNYKDFLNWIAFKDIQENLIYQKSAVKVMTIHGSKGLEFEEVIIFGANEGIIPERRSEIEEERRLFYVAMTRAKKSLYLAVIKQIINEYTNKAQILEESRFIGEFKTIQ